MANHDQLAELVKGAASWNAWRKDNSDITPDLHGAYLRGAGIGSADLRGADLRGANLRGAGLGGADLRGADLHGADLGGAHLHGARFCGADLYGANFGGAHLREAHLCGADLRLATLVNTDLTGADLSGCQIYGLSAWGVILENTKQDNLVITPRNEPQITVDNIEVAQFVYLLLNNKKIRDVIDTVGKKAVLLLGRFTEGRAVVLDRLREELRKRDFLPIVFNFDKPETRDFTETVRLLAYMSRFVIADITKPKSTPLELHAIIPECMIPFATIIEEGEPPFAMFKDLWLKYKSWVFPPISYSSVEELVRGLDKGIIDPAQERFKKLVIEKSGEMPATRMSEIISGQTVRTAGSPQ